MGYRDYRLWWVSSAAVLFNQTMTQICLAWLILRLTDSAVWVSVTVFAFGLPSFLLTIPAGVLADRWDRRKQLMTAQSVAAVNAVVLAVLVGMDTIGPSFALVFAFISGTTVAMSQPARQSMIPQLLPPKDLMNGIVLGSLSQNLAQLVGPALAGVLIALVSISAALFMLASLLAVGIVCLVLMHLPPVHREGPPARLSLAELFGGFHFLWSEKPLLVVAGPYLATGIWIGGSIQALVPVLVRQEYHEGASALGLAFSCQATAAIFTVLWIAGQRSLRYKGALFALSMWVASLAVIWYGLAPDYTAALAGFLVFGACTAFYANMSQTILQTHTPPHLLGRVLSILTLATQGLHPAGGLAGRPDRQRNRRQRRDRLRRPCRFPTRFCSPGIRPAVPAPELRHGHEREADNLDYAAAGSRRPRALRRLVLLPARLQEGHLTARGRPRRREHRVGSAV